MEFIVKIVSVIGGRGRIIGQSKNVTEWKIRLSDYGVEWKKLSEYGAKGKKLSEYGAKGKWGVLREGGGGRVGEFGRVGPVVVSQDTWGKQSGYIRQGANKSGHKRTYLDTWVWGTTNNESLVKIYEAQGSIKKGSKDKKFRQVKNSVVSHLNHLFNLWHSAYFGKTGFLGDLESRSVRAAILMPLADMVKQKHSTRKLYPTSCLQSWEFWCLTWVTCYCPHVPATTSTPGPLPSSIALLR